MSNEQFRAGYDYACRCYKRGVKTNEILDVSREHTKVFREGMHCAVNAFEHQWHVFYTRLGTQGISVVHWQELVNAAANAQLNSQRTA